MSRKPAPEITVAEAQDAQVEERVLEPDIYATEADLETAIEGAVAAEPEPTSERQPDFMWSGLPVYRCRLCRDQYERVGNLAAVLDHEATQHPTNARVSQILGPGGQPLIVVD